ncbi:MAG TPA: TetR/AcrR family transcriptional regulator [Caulobacteraceae bacterium]|nr:TetR/AcrR family transcriptional regulator [Caulobacteraceae bacterium]
MAVAARSQVPLSRRDWLEAGQALLRKQGVAGLKLRPLAASLGISTGSFYHHFDDFDAFLAELARYYSGEQLAENLRRVRSEAHTPYERIVRASQVAHEVVLSELIGAMRAWARRDPSVAVEVEALEQALMAFVAECFADLGFSADEAKMRAFVLLCAASGGVTPPDLAAGKGALGRLIIEMACAGAPDAS